MEYEIVYDCEPALFDRSTNPSLSASWWPGPLPLAERAHARPAEGLQKALLIPEEDHQFA